MHKWSGRHSAGVVSAGVVAGNNETFSEENKSSAKMKANKKKKNKNKKNKDLFSEKIETEVKNIIEEDDKNEKEVSESLKTVSSLEPFSAEISNQFILDEYENFDDYLEMVSQWG
jgi:hypothetical protein